MFDQKISTKINVKLVIYALQNVELANKKKTHVHIRQYYNTIELTFGFNLWDSLKYGTASV